MRPDEAAAAWSAGEVVALAALAAAPAMIGRPPAKPTD
jgi:hypothetical protein